MYTLANFIFIVTNFSSYGVLGLGEGARRKNATRETTSTLKAWLNEHRKNPYPTKAEKIMLAIVTRMTLTQVSNSFKGPWQLATNKVIKLSIRIPRCPLGSPTPVVVWKRKTKWLGRHATVAGRTTMTTWMTVTWWGAAEVPPTTWAAEPRRPSWSTSTTTTPTTPTAWGFPCSVRTVPESEWWRHPPVMTCFRAKSRLLALTKFPRAKNQLWTSCTVGRAAATTICSKSHHL